RRAKARGMNPGPSRGADPGPSAAERRGAAAVAKGSVLADARRVTVSAARRPRRPAARLLARLALLGVLTSRATADRALARRRAAGRSRDVGRVQRPAD